MNIEYNKKCYQFEKKDYNSGFLDKSVDATYIIHLENIDRRRHIDEQLTSFHPTRIIYIVHNQGFKKCDKKLIEQVSYQDLTDAFLQCFRDADEKGYNNILILEDDFIFNPEIKDNENLDVVNDFLLKKKDEVFIYYLGCNPLIIMPYDWNHYYSFESLSMHAIVYSRETRKLPLDLDLKHWDVIMKHCDASKYFYYKPLCYQTYPETENKKNWSEKDSWIISYMKSWIIQGLELDNKPEPGFSTIYVLAKSLFYVFVFLLLWAILSLSSKKRYKK
jgi:hypothetical protein